MFVAMRNRVLGAAVALVASLLQFGGVHAAELYMFESRGCPWCVRWHAEIGPAYPKTSEGRRAPLRRLDLGHASSAGVALAVPVTVAPTFVLVESGKEIGRITGYPGPDFFWGLLAELLAKLDTGPQRAGELQRFGDLSWQCRRPSPFAIL